MSATNTLLAACCWACLLFSAGCFPSPLKSIDPQYRAAVDKLSRMPWEERKAALESSDLETQYAWYIYSGEESHPTSPYHARGIAANGEIIVPLLCRKFNEAQDHGTARQILYVFYWMFKDGHHSVAENAEVMRILAENIKRLDPQPAGLPTRIYKELQFSSDTFVNSYTFSDHRCQNWVTSFFRNPQASVEQFKAFDTENQFALILCGQQAWQPSTSIFEKELAQTGGRAIPYLQSTLQQSINTTAIHEALWILDLMSIFKTYDIAKDEILCTIINETIQRLPKSYERDKHERWFAKVIWK